MLKFLHIAWIFNFCILLADLSSDFKHVVLFCLDELLGLRYIVGKFQMFSFYSNFNQSKISPVALICPKQYTKVLFDIFDNINLLTLTFWNIMFSIFVWPENLPQYIFIYLIFPYKILALFNIRFERYVQSRKMSQHAF